MPPLIATRGAASVRGYGQFVKTVAAVIAQAYVDDVFAMATRIGTGATATVTSRVNLSSKGGVIFTKRRDSTGVYRATDTARGATNALTLNSTAAQSADTTGITAFGTTGHTVGSDGGYNTSGALYEDMVFCKGAKFLDIVTYTGNGSARTLSHALGITPGMMIVRRYDGTDSTNVWHRSFTSSAYYAAINNTNDQASDSTIWNSTDPTSSQFTVGTGLSVNGGLYVAYLFAHDTSSTGIVQCGSFSSDGSGNATVSLGWEPQSLLIKRIGSTGPWYTMDIARGFIASPGTTSPYMALNSSSAEASWAAVAGPTGAGFTFGGLATSANFVYMAIRRSNKPPTSGSQIYGAVGRTGTSAAANITGLGFSPDIFLGIDRAHAISGSSQVVSRLRGVGKRLSTSATTGEATENNGVTSFDMDGYSLGTDANYNSSSATFINYLFKRAVTAITEACYVGTTAAQAISHDLGVVPEMILAKRRDSTSGWFIYHKALGNANTMYLDTTAAAFSSIAWDSTTPTNSAFRVGVAGTTPNVNGATYDAILFASLAGIIKVDSYTGNGTSQTINCGFAAGARFVLIMRYDSTGDRYVFDTVRGIVSANDPHLSLNTSSAEVTTDDTLDPDNSGFIVNQVSATNLNVSGATYAFIAIA